MPSIIEADIVLSPSLIKIFEEELGIDNDLLNIKIIKKDKIRYFVNFTPIAKKQLSLILSRFVKHIHSRGGDELGESSLLGLLDQLAIAEIPQPQGEPKRLPRAFPRSESAQKGATSPKKRASKRPGA